MKKVLLVLFSIILLFTITGCGPKKENQNNNQPEQNQEEKNNQQSNSNNSYIDDDEIIDIEDEENQPPTEEKVKVEKVINCDGCVYAYFSAEGDNAKKLGDTVSKDEYTNDINTLRTSGNKQRHNFFGLVLSGNTISKAYSCILKDNIIYCIQGSTDGAYHSNNIGILNQIFTADQCKTISDGNNYWCSDGSYNGNSKTNGYTALHYETSCTIYGSDSNTGKLICH
jgi:predicted small lipoprotein YifL